MKTEGRWLTPADVEYIRRAADAFPALVAVAQAVAALEEPGRTWVGESRAGEALRALEAQFPDWREWQS